MGARLRQLFLGHLDDLGLFAADISVTKSNVADAASSSLRLAVDGYDRQHRVYPAGDYGDTAEGRALQQGYETLSPISMRAGDVCVNVTYRPVLPHEAACAEGEPGACGF